MECKCRSICWCHINSGYDSVRYYKNQITSQSWIKSDHREISLWCYLLGGRTQKLFQRRGNKCCPVFDIIWIDSANLWCASQTFRNCVLKIFLNNHNFISFSNWSNIPSVFLSLFRNYFNSGSINLSYWASSFFSFSFSRWFALSFFYFSMASYTKLSSLADNKFV